MPPQTLDILFAISLTPIQISALREHSNSVHASLLRFPRFHALPVAFHCRRRPVPGRQGGGAAQEGGIRREGGVHVQESQGVELRRQSGQVRRMEHGRGMFYWGLFLVAGISSFLRI